jgi:hypothetical protein
VSHTLRRLRLIIAALVLIIAFAPANAIAAERETSFVFSAVDETGALKPVLVLRAGRPMREPWLGITPDAIVMISSDEAVKIAAIVSPDSLVKNRLTTYTPTRGSLEIQKIFWDGWTTPGTASYEISPADVPPLISRLIDALSVSNARARDQVLRIADQVKRSVKD